MSTDYSSKISVDGGFTNNQIEDDDGEATIEEDKQGDTVLTESGPDQKIKIKTKNSKVKVIRNKGGHHEKQNLAVYSDSSMNFIEDC